VAEVKKAKHRLSKFARAKALIGKLCDKPVVEAGNKLSGCIERARSKKNELSEANVAKKVGVTGVPSSVKEIINGRVLSVQEDVKGVLKAGVWVCADRVGRSNEKVLAVTAAGPTGKHFDEESAGTGRTNGWSQEVEIFKEFGSGVQDAGNLTGMPTKTKTSVAAGRANGWARGFESFRETGTLGQGRGNSTGMIKTMTSTFGSTGRARDVEEAFAAESGVNEVKCCNGSKRAATGRSMI